MAETLHLDATRPENVQRAAEILRTGGLVAFPTETVYGLGADALSPEAVARIFAAKQRPTWDPLIVHLESLASLDRVCAARGVPRERIDALARTFWPGPLTLLVPRAAEIPALVTAGRPTVGVRVPAHPVAQALLRAAGVPVAAPSANRFGHTSPTTARHVLEDLAGRIDAVLDAGPAAVGVESTVIDPLQDPMVMYRAGAVTAEMLWERTRVPVTLFDGLAPVEADSRESLPSPGVGIRHYAPDARLVLCGPSEREVQLAVSALMPQESSVGVLLPEPWHVKAAPALEVEPWGSWDAPESLAAALFAGLRALESRGVTAMVCPLPPPGGLRDAIRDRLLKAAKPR